MNGELEKTQVPRVDVVPSGNGVTEIHLAGAFLMGRERVKTGPLPIAPASVIRLVDKGIAGWDSSLLAVVLGFKKQAEEAKATVDYTGLPAGAVRLLDLALAVPERAGSRREKSRESFLAAVGNSSIRSFAATRDAVTFLGDATISVGRFLTGRAQYRKSEFWLIIQQCGPQALGIITTISVLVGAILAFVGSIQLKMFGAEIYVANLVGLGMVIEMGALMTGIVLAGRTGASFAAQLGTMQVNEEIDALQTMGIRPMDYLVMPRMVALALMTPLLVIYADILGILGGAVVGVFALGLSPVVYFNQTFDLMTIGFCLQGLIKGSTFGVLVAICGCMRGMMCGRSALAVGEAATTAVVSSIVAIVVADAVWTFIFMVTQ